MARYRTALPQLGEDLFITDGGIETTLIFDEGLELPEFAAFHLLRTPEGERALKRYFTTYIALTQRLGLGLVLETATWRCSADWGAKLGYGWPEIADANVRLVHMLEELRGGPGAASGPPVVISGCVGPRGDGYVPGNAMSLREADDYHGAPVEVFAGTSADLVSAVTMNRIEEAAGSPWLPGGAGCPW